MANGQATGDDVNDRAPDGVPQAGGGRPPAGSRARVLFMDDHAPLLRLVHELFALSGYEIECVEDGAAAVERYRLALEAGQPFDVVILDLAVPAGMGGKETLDRLRALDPDVTAVVSSGYSNDPIVAEFRAHGFTARMLKPYKLEDLLRLVSQFERRRLQRGDQAA